MSESREISSSRKTANQTSSVANNVSAGARSFPAVSALTSEKPESGEENLTLQLKSRTGAEVSDDLSGTSQQNKHNVLAVQKKANNTGMPDKLKSGIESISGYDMSDVNVHYNSAKPAQLNALAYAQGTNIHVAPGQEKHVPHEAWHVVQQKQGRVKPTIQMKAGIQVNDDPGLENEADVMGAKALQINNNDEAPSQRKGAESSSIVQRNPAAAPTIASGHSYSKHVVTQKEWGDPPMKKAAFAPIVADVMNNPDASKDLKNGRKGYWKGDIVVIYDPSTGDKGTCFKPTLGKKYYDNLT